MATSTPRSSPVNTGQSARARLTAQMEARIAYMRFGLGPKPSTPLSHWTNKTAAYGALRAELEAPDSATIPDVPMNVVRYGKSYQVTGGNGLDLFGVPTDRQCGQSLLGESHKLWLMADLRARYRKQQEPTIGFLERLVLFWSNHFSIHWGKDIITVGSTGYCERKAIRQNVLKTFPEMLWAVITQPAMIAYLDNNSNIGPNSSWGYGTRTRKEMVNGVLKTVYYMGVDPSVAGQKHIKENLAREVLELHTVGKGGAGSSANYSQDDVDALACILTGFQYGRNGLFGYFSASHEPGDYVLLGKTYRQTYWDTRTRLPYEPPSWMDPRAKMSLMSPQQAKSALDDLARDRRTALHLAEKLIRHFITDNPSPGSVAYLADAFGPNGDLKAMSLALLELPEAWDPPSEVRMRTPQLLQVAINRALDFSADQINALSSVEQFFEGPLDSYLYNQNHLVWGRMTPDGYPDQNIFWDNENATRLRTTLTYDYIRKCVDRLSSKGISFTLPAANALAGSLFKNGGISASSVALASASRASATAQADKAANLTLLFMTTEYLLR